MVEPANSGAKAAPVMADEAIEALIALRQVVDHWDVSGYSQETDEILARAERIIARYAAQ